MENELHAIRNEETKNEKRRKRENHRWEKRGWGRGVKGEIPKVRNGRVEEATGERKGRSLGIGGEKVEEKRRWRGKKGRGGFQERIEGESNLLRRTHTYPAFHPSSSPSWLALSRVQVENSHKCRSANTCTSRYIAPLCPAHGKRGVLLVSLVNEQLHVHPTNGTTRPPPSGSSYDPRIAVFWHTNPGVGSAYTVGGSLVGARPQHSRRPRLVSCNRGPFGNARSTFPEWR